jgi:hypothetical protein
MSQRFGQMQANGPGDFATLNALQAQYKLTPTRKLPFGWR